MIMQIAASQGHFQQQSRRSSALVAGVSAALVASALTVVLTMSVCPLKSRLAPPK